MLNKLLNTFLLIQPNLSVKTYVYDDHAPYTTHNNAGKNTDDDYSYNTKEETDRNSIRNCSHDQDKKQDQTKKTKECDCKSHNSVVQFNTVKIAIDKDVIEDPYRIVYDRNVWLQLK
ncbi:hypothetical protein Trydic_g12309 [Trypoxylus dichotomus]